MGRACFPKPDKNGIINALPSDISEENLRRLKKFDSLKFIYDFAQEFFVRPRIHKADPKRHKELLSTLISPVKNSRILDIACGTGCAIYLFDNTNEYFGLDLSYSMLKQAAKKAKKKSFKNYRLIQGNAEKLLFEKESFDFILMDTALHIIPKYQHAVQEIANVLTKNGLFICSTPAFGINEEFDINWKKIANKHSLNLLTIDEIKKVCNKNCLNYTQFAINGGLLYFKANK